MPTLECAPEIGMMSIQADEPTNESTDQPTAESASDAGNVYQLWLLPPGANPLSLGLLTADSGVRETELSLAQIDALRITSTLAISIEPTGGSPTGLPTGPVVYQASLVNL